jgi:hypothetical protein
MRSQRYEILAAFMTVLGIALRCFAQPQPGPATPEGLVNAGVAQEAPAAAESESANAGPKPPAGTAVRPEDGVQHPDLDKAWAEYDATVTKAAEGIKAVISKQFDAATAKGDLNAAQKWQVIGEKFAKTGELPAESDARLVSVAIAELKKAKEKLAKAYESVVKDLTIEKKITEATAVRGEWLAIDSDEAPVPKPTPLPPNPVSLRDQVLSVAVGAWRHRNGNLEEIRQDGSWVINGDPRNRWSGTWVLDLGDPNKPCIVRQENSGRITRWHVDLLSPNQIASDAGGLLRKESAPR